MSRLEKKCMVASCCLHGFLVALVLFGGDILRFLALRRRYRRLLEQST